MGMICMRYLDSVPISREDMTLIEDQRNFSVPGLRWHVQGTSKLSIEIEDPWAFEQYIAQQRSQLPEFDRMILEREAQSGHTQNHQGPWLGGWGWVEESGGHGGQNDLFLVMVSTENW